MFANNHNVLAFRKRSNDSHKKAIAFLAGLLAEHQLTVKVVPYAEVDGKKQLLSEIQACVDVLLIEVEDESPFVTIRTNNDEPAVEGELLFRHRQADLCQKDFAEILHHLDQNHVSSPLWACILIGGKSSRMGHAKHLLPHSTGKSWLEECVQRVQPHVEKIVLSGAGDVPESLQHLERIDDAPGVVGPLSGILGATRFQPDVAWLLLACDMPLLSTEAIAWLVGQRKIGCWGIVPKRNIENDLKSDAAGRYAHKGKKGLEPLFACYERQCGPLFEGIVQEGSLKIREIADCEKIYVVPVPRFLEKAWTNVNTPQAFKAL